LLEIDPAKRLREIDKIKEHEFFTSIDWEKIREKQVTPPHSPGNERKDSPKQEVFSILL